MLECVLIGWCVLVVAVVLAAAIVLAAAVVLVAAVVLAAAVALGGISDCDQHLLGRQQQQLSELHSLLRRLAQQIAE